YQDLLRRYEARLLRAPDDDATRVEIGRLQIKRGLHEKAASNLLQAARNPSMRASALYDAAVALHRGGKLEESARVSSDALHWSPKNERARAWHWLTAKRLGGYPEFVATSQRRELKVVFEKPTVEFEGVASKIGMDKTRGGRGLTVFDYNN